MEHNEHQRADDLDAYWDGLLRGRTDPLPAGASDDLVDLIARLHRASRTTPLFASPWQAWHEVAPRTTATPLAGESPVTLARPDGRTLWGAATSLPAVWDAPDPRFLPNGRSDHPLSASGADPVGPPRAGRWSQVATAALMTLTLVASLVAFWARGSWSSEPPVALLAVPGETLFRDFVTSMPPGPTAAQDASWLDGDLASWNAAGMEIPAAPAVDGNTDPRCRQGERPAETPEDAALVAAGWRLFQSYQRGWDVTLVSGLASYDGMCRPLGYQSFVFIEGTFAGTVAPGPMNSRTDGAASDVNLGKDRLSAEFVRYTADDPLCCPSSTTSVPYTIEETADGPVLNPVPSP